MTRRILYIQYTNPAGYPPLEHSSRILAEQGWSVVFLGTGASGADHLQFPPHAAIQVYRMAFQTVGWKQKIHYLRYLLWCLWWTVKWRPACVYASDLLATPAGWLLSFWPGIKVIYHEHDSPTPSNLAGAFGKALAWCRTQLARRAFACVLPNARRIEVFQKTTQTSRPVLCVWNCPRQEEAALSPARGGPLTVYFHGSIVPVRLPATLLDAIADTPQTCLRVVGYATAGHRGYVEELKSKAAALGIADRVEFLPAVSRSELWRLCAQADVGLAWMPIESSDINEQAMTGASNKPFDYLAAGMALLVTDLPEWRTMFVDSGFARACDPGQSESIASELRWFQSNRAAVARMGSEGRLRIINDWNYEKQFQPVKELIEQADT